MTYLGSKAASGAYQAIIALMPPHDTYIETHLGMGAVLRNKPLAQKSYALDLNKKVVSAVKKAMPDSSIHYECGCSHAFLEDYQFDGRELIYCDPPYLLSTRTSNKRYVHEYTLDDHKALLKILTNLECSIIISGYPSALYDKTLKSWNTKTFQVMTRGGVRTEQVWFNYDIESSYWSSFAGSNFTDRQRIKRKAQRWASNYQDLPAGERVAILSALLAVEVESSDQA